MTKPDRGDEAGPVIATALVGAGLCAAMWPGEPAVGCFVGAVMGVLVAVIGGRF